MTYDSITRRRLIGGVSGAVAAGALGTPARAQAEVLRVRSYVDIGKLDPLFMVSRETDGALCDAIYSRLIRYESGTAWQWQLDAAEQIEQVDATHVRFRLRPGIMFSNGYGTMTAEDVQYSFERYLDPALDSPYKGDWTALDRVEIEDELSGTIVLKEPYAPLFTTTLPWSAGYILSKRAIEEVGGVFDVTPPAMSGAFLLSEWVPGQRIGLVRNEDYYGARSPFDEIVMLPIGDDKAAEIAFEAGEIDYTNVSASSIASMVADPPEGGQIQVRPSETYFWIGMNVEHPLFTDQRVRQAVQYAVDVDEIIEAAFFGITPRATGLVAPGMIGHREANLISGPDLDKARALLAEAGHPDGFDTTISVLNQTDRVAAAQVIQAQLAQIGIRVEVLAYESGTYWSLGNDRDGDDWKDLQLMFLRFTSAPDPGWATVWFTCDQVGLWNWERWCNEEYSNLNAEAARTSDPDSRNAMYVAMQDLMEESGAYIFVTHEATAVLYRDGIVPGNRPNNDTQLSDFRLA